MSFFKELGRPAQFTELYIEHVAYNNMYVGFLDLHLWTCVIIFECS